MKVICWFLALILTASLHDAVAQSAKLPLPETGHEATITLTRPGLNIAFHSLTILSDGKRSTFSPKNQVIRVPADPDVRAHSGIWTDIAGLKLHSSRFFLQGSYSVDAHPHTLLFFLGEGGIGAAPVFVVGFSDNGQPFKVLERSELDVTSLQSTPSGALIIGKTSLSEVMDGDRRNSSKSPYATTYDPFSVFIVHPSAPATYSFDASRTYNQQHYVWAGPQVREDYAVLYNMPGRSKLLGAPASKVHDLLTHAGGK